MARVKTRSEQGTKDLICRTVQIDGIMPLMFDRYPGDNDTKLLPPQKLYFGEDGSTIVMPSPNLMSFLSAKNTDSAPKAVLDVRKYKKFTEACASFVVISSLADTEDIPILRNGRPIVFSGFGSAERCPTSGIYIRRDTARLKDGLPNPKVRPVLPLAWSLVFKLEIYPNQQIQEQQIKNVIELGGIAVGLGTWRKRFGKFVISRWE